MSESKILKQVMVEASRLGFKIFRNHVGGVKGADGFWHKFGLHNGSADLIGWRKVTITPDMVGREIAVFSSIEVKNINGTLRPDQRTWKNRITEDGGFAIVTDNTSDLKNLFDTWIKGA